ncbi:MAG: hypothetical protein DRJ40_02485 [Thermoprotei archaeon]|nr:MAG: hypothetical protein DRJ40_02485 [Thermoprotei archaeon]
MQFSELKQKILELLRTDIEFRYAVAGLLGLEEILRKLDEHSRILKEHSEILRKHSEILERHSKILEEHSKILKEHTRLLHRLVRDVADIKRTIERITISLEEEAREVIAHRLREKLGIEVPLSRLELPELEINIYGIANDYVVIGECTTRLGIRKVRELLEKYRVLRERYRNYLRPKIVLTIYAMTCTREAIKEAEGTGIWLNTATKEETTLRVLSLD